MSSKYDKVSTDNVDDEHPIEATENTQLNNDRDGENITDMTHLPRKRSSKCKIAIWIGGFALLIIIILAVVLTAQYKLPPEEKPIDPQETSSAIKNYKKEQS